MKNYLKVVYDVELRPHSSYPEKLGKYLFDNFGMKPGMKLLEIGCGRGDILKKFKELGLEVEGFDLDEEAVKLNEGIPVQLGNIESNPLPYMDNSFDVVYSKSLLEHLYYPERYMTEVYRVLRPNGLLLTLVPDWESNYKIYFDDYSHRTPFSIVSLHDIYKMFNFREVKVVKFRQLPVVWRYPALSYICAIIAPFVPIRTKNKFLRWSRELMLIGVGRK